MFYKYIICILVYRNTEDILECILSIKNNIKDFKIVIVNSYYDDITQRLFKQIAENNNCDFINVPNKGYGYGNNKGISHCLKCYKFDYLIVSNPDIVIHKFDDRYLNKYSDCVVAPLITTIKGKSQNPYWYKKNNFSERLIYLGMKKQNRQVLYFGLGLNKLIREIALFLFKHSSKHQMIVYAAHGSFCMFPYTMFQLLGLPFDEKMFLFAEEAYLAHLLEDNKIKVILTKDIKILHKEDGSIGLAHIDEASELRKSIIYYYEKIKKSS